MRIDKAGLGFIKGKLKFNEPMSRHTTFKIGGPADILVEPLDKEDLLNILRYADENKISCFVLGGGSKLLVGDKGIRGFVISLGGPGFKGMEFDGSAVDSGCGVRLSEFIRQAASRDMGGSEFLAGVPGTVGGALIMNAGWPSESIGDLVEEVTVIKGLKEVKLKRRDIRFSYRSSGLEGFILVGARFKMVKKERDKVLAEIKENLNKKRDSQDLIRPSVGCIFKNPPGNVSAGKLIEASGFKGHSIGGAIVSEKHANFIVNGGDAKASDVLRLIDEIQKKVFNEHKIMLELEVKLVGEF